MKTSCVQQGLCVVIYQNNLFGFFSGPCDLRVQPKMLFFHEIDFTEAITKLAMN